MAADGGACIICLDTSPPPIQSGCACRGDSGLAQIACLVQAAASQQARRGWGVLYTIVVWQCAQQECQTCKHWQDYTPGGDAGGAGWGVAVAGRRSLAGGGDSESERRKDSGSKFQRIAMLRSRCPSPS
jgi:hypothetical protein